MANWSTVRGYGQYCPVAKAAEVLGDRWTLLIMRELIEGVERFNELERGLPGISRSLLAQRLRALESSGLIDRRVDGDGRPSYRLTAAGRSAEGPIMALGEWAARTLMEPVPEPRELDPSLLMWWIHRHVRRDGLPAGRTVLRVDFTGPKRATGMVVVNSPAPGPATQVKGGGPAGNGSARQAGPTKIPFR